MTYGEDVPDALFRNAVALDPEDPTGHAFQALNHLFGSEVSFDPKQREASQEAMLRSVGEALARGEERVAKNPRDGQAYFAMALARTAKFSWALRKKQTFTAAQRFMASGPAWKGCNRKTRRITTAIC